MLDLVMELIMREPLTLSELPEYIIIGCKTAGAGVL
jgi:hypothetical protein